MNAKRLYLGTNTKMTKTIAETLAFLAGLDRLTVDVAEDALELFVIPSFTTLESAGKQLQNSHIRLGAQNMAWEDKGVFTGEISPLMLKECGVALVELGHSERRHVLGETDDMINRKVHCALRNKLPVLLCVGETAKQKELGLSKETLAAQCKEDLFGVTTEDASSLWVAYEPVWAIGEGGIPATEDYAEEMHAFLRETLTGLFGEKGEEIPLLYGGSVNPQNAMLLLGMPHIDGLFIGRSAWEVKGFSQIIHEAVRLWKGKKHS